MPVEPINKATKLVFTFFVRRVMLHSCS